MSTLSNQEVAELVRRRMNMPVNSRLRFHPLINDALRVLSYKIARNRNLRHWLMTEPTTTQASLDGQGVADLTTLIASPRILLECLRYGNIFHESNAYPLQPLSTVEQGTLRGYLDTVFLHYHLEGFKLFTKTGDDTFLSGVLTFNTPYWPSLSQLPDPLNEMLVGEVEELLVESPQKYEEEEAA